MPAAGSCAQAEAKGLAEPAAYDCDYWNMGVFLV